MLIHGMDLLSDLPAHRHVHDDELRVRPRPEHAAEDGGVLDFGVTIGASASNCVEGMEVERGIGTS